MKKVYSLTILLAIFGNARADYFENLPYKITQPDGQVLNLFISGDEFYSRIHDSRNYTIIQAPDGFYYYAKQDGDLVKPSVYRAGRIDPEKAGFKKDVKISPAEYHNRFDRVNNYRTLRKGTASSAPQTGLLNNIVIYIRFDGDSEFTQSRQYFYNTFNPSAGNTLNSYFREVSYNKLDIESVHYPSCSPDKNLSYKDYRPRTFFEPYNETTNPDGYRNFDEKTLREHSLLSDAVSWINNNSPVSQDLNLDANSDGMVDNVCFILRGNGSAWNDLLWAHRWALYSKEAYINGKRVYSYIFQPEGQLSVRTLCHEMFHVIGAPDLYHYDNQANINPVGCWDIMEGGAGHMSAYMKWKYSGNSWITDIPEITSSGTYRLNALTSPSGNCYRIKSPVSESEYFILEYRKKSGSFEISLPGSGLIISRIVSGINGNASGPPDEIYIFRPGGTITTNGDYLEAYLNSSSGRSSITNTSNPFSFLQDGTPGGLSISDIREDGSQIVFSVDLSSTGSNPDPRESILTAADQKKEIRFSVYPNPTASYIRINIEEVQDPVSVVIYDITGRMIHSAGQTETYRSGNQIEYDLSDEASGMYIVEVKNGKVRKKVNLIKL